MGVTILCFRSQSNAIGESGLEAIEIGSYHVQMPIRHQPGQILPNALPHDTRLAVIYGETILQQNRGYARG
jgi:hypothetical protein